MCCWDIVRFCWTKLIIISWAGTHRMDVIYKYFNSTCSHKTTNYILVIICKKPQNVHFNSQNTKFRILILQIKSNIVILKSLQAVCCSDGKRCCPQNFTCDLLKDACIRKDHIVPEDLIPPNTTPMLQHRPNDANRGREHWTSLSFSPAVGLW